MIKCRYCIEKNGESRSFEHLPLHLLNMHGMLPKEYLQMYPNAPLTSAKFKQKQKDLMKKRHREIPDLVARSQKWRDAVVKLDPIENPTIDDLESLEAREKWLRLNLASGVTGTDYKKIYLELMSIRVLLKDTLEDYFEKEEQQNDRC